MTQRRRIIHVCTLCLLGGIVILKEDGFSEQEYDPRRNFMKLRLSDDIAYESKIRSRNDIEEEEEEEEEAAAAATRSVWVRTLLSHFYGDFHPMTIDCVG